VWAWSAPPPRRPATRDVHQTHPSDIIGYHPSFPRCRPQQREQSPPLCHVLAAISCADIPHSHMRPIGNPLLGQGRGCTSPTLRSINPPSSRGSSPTPPRHPSPPTGIQTIGEHDHMHSHEHEHDHDHDHDHDHKARTGSDASEFSTGGISVLTRSSSCSRDAVVDASGVVHKSIFGGDTSAQSPPSGGRRASGSRPSGTGRRRRAR
jgi:hypothetical protein